jgi:competence protein ComEA
MNFKTLVCIVFTLFLSNAFAQQSNTKQSFNKVEKVVAKVININTASEKLLTTLPGIGKIKAAEIIKYRQLHGQFKEVSDLRKVNGIGDKLFAKIQGNIKL